MNLLKKIGRAFIFPHPTVIWLLVPLSVALLLDMYIWEIYPLPNVIPYILTVYTIFVSSLRIREIVVFLKKIKEENKYVSRIVTDVRLRVKVSLYGALAINISYAIFQLTLGVYHSSLWFYAFAVYYFSLAVMRFFILRDVRGTTAEKDMLSEYKRYRKSGVLLLFMNLTLAFIVFYIARQGRGFTQHFVTTTIVAIFTLSVFTIAIVNVIRFKKYNSPLFSAAKVITFSSALVSMLMLESTVLTEYERGGDTFLSRTMMGATGTFVCIVILLMATYMIIRATKQIKKLTLEDRKSEVSQI